MGQGWGWGVWLFKVFLGACRCPLVSLTRKPQKVKSGRDLFSLPILCLGKWGRREEQQPRAPWYGVECRSPDRSPLLLPPPWRASYVGAPSCVLTQRQPSPTPGAGRESLSLSQRLPGSATPVRSSVIDRAEEERPFPARPGCAWPARGPQPSPSPHGDVPCLALCPGPWRDSQPVHVVLSSALNLEYSGFL